MFVCSYVCYFKLFLEIFLNESIREGASVAISVASSIPNQNEIILNKFSLRSHILVYRDVYSVGRYISSDPLQYTRHRKIDQRPGVISVKMMMMMMFLVGGGGGGVTPCMYQDQENILPWGGGMFHHWTISR